MKFTKKLIDSKYVKKIICISMALFLVFKLIAPTFVYADINRFRVSTSEEFIEAVKKINDGADDAEYVIEMLNDIKITSRVFLNHNSSLEFKKGKTTIYGNNFVLNSSYPTDTLIQVTDNAIVNLGSADEPEKSKLFVNETDATTTTHPDLLGIVDSATVNVYDGVVFQNNSPIGRPGGAISVGELSEETNAKLNMYGGIIRNCKETFVGYGGAVFVGPGSTFTMNGGIIENNTSNYGGGVFNVGNFTMNGGVIQNNVATLSADDIYSEGNMQLNVAANKDNGFGKLLSTNKQINGWFVDLDDAWNGLERWTEEDYVEITPEDASNSEAIGLKAAHTSNVNVIFNVNSGVWNDSSDKFVESSNNTYLESIPAGSTSAKPVEPTKTDYVFLGWYTKDGEEYNFDTVVNEDITLYAKWKYNNYKDYVILDKTYIIADGFTGAGEIITSDGKIKEDVTLAIESYNSFNREVGKTDIPAFAESEYKFTTGIGADEIQIALPDFSGYGIGDYWYKVTEITGDTAGVTYDTNEYFMHIVVAHVDPLNPDDYGVTQITLHKSAPNEDGTYVNNESEKSTGVTNNYAAGSILVTKDIKGNFADRTKKFDIVVTFNAPEGKTVKSDIYYSDGTVAVAADAWNDSVAEVTIELGLGDVVEFKNIPAGVTYTVAEKDYSLEGYENPVYTIDNEEDGDVINTGSEWSANGVQGTITDDADKITITNEKNATIDVGVFFENSPFVALILMSGAMLVVMIVARRRKVIDEEQLLGM